MKYNQIYVISTGSMLKNSNISCILRANFAEWIVAWVIKIRRAISYTKN